MQYVEVAVDAPVAHSRTFSYSVPDQFDLEPGQLVWVPFGRQVAQGVALKLDADPPPAGVKARDVLQPVEPSPLVSPALLELARWISRYYLCPLFDAISLMLPPEFKAQVRSQIFPLPFEESDLEPLRPQVRSALQKIAGKSRIGEGELVKSLGSNGGREVNRLVERGLVKRQVDLPRPGTFRYESYLIPAGQGRPEASRPDPPAGLPARQEELLRAVRSANGPYPAVLANKEFGRAAGTALIEKGLLGVEWVRVDSQPISGDQGQDAGPAITLTPPQAAAVASITSALDEPDHRRGDSGRPDLPQRSFLLHGVTGSGKTEVYLQAIQRVVKQGKQAVLLVPEIALTPQTVHRVNARFPGRVAVLHSRLRARDKFDQWWKIRDGAFDVVVGPRSALFAPLPSLGLIVIDEEHEWTYKQEENQPLYHARAVALEMSRLTGAAVVMGSATPDVETYYNARRGRHTLLHLPQRIRAGAENEVGDAEPGLARVEICDMREELRQGNRDIFSRGLAQALRDCLDRGQQAILFLNRRGSAPFVQCRDCGYVAACRHCSVSLTYHATDSRLVCHRCNRRTRPPRRCRQCGETRIRQLGIGTQRVVDEVSRLFPGVQVERWDADASRAGPGPEELMRRLSSGETRVLVGTQMVAKGLDVPNVTLVGVILADVGLHLPDFRAGERAFALLCQVSGRSGRGAAAGRVIIQTYSPEHYAIQAAVHQDYQAMYRREIDARYQQGNPPFNQLVHLVHYDVNAARCQNQAVNLARLLRQKRYGQGLTDVEVIGPAPGIPERVRGHHRWHTILRGQNLQGFLEGVSIPRECKVDVDPAHVL